METRHNYRKAFTAWSWLDYPLEISTLAQYLRIKTVLGKPDVDLPLSKFTNHALSYYFWKQIQTTLVWMPWKDSVCISSIYLDSQSTETSRGSESFFWVNHNSNIVDTKLIFRALDYLSKVPNYFTTKNLTFLPVFGRRGIIRKSFKKLFLKLRKSKLFTCLK